jgi:hypothetical protein
MFICFLNHSRHRVSSYDVNYTILLKRKERSVEFSIQIYLRKGAIHSLTQSFSHISYLLNLGQRRIVSYLVC